MPTTPTSSKRIAICWLRRDLRLEDNTALHHALESGVPVLPLFIFDDNILQELPRNDARVSFIHHTLNHLHQQLQQLGSSLLCLQGDPLTVWQQVLKTYAVAEVYANRDYEPYALQRDAQIAQLLQQQHIAWHTYKDHVIFEANEVLTDRGLPYTIYTPYKNKWLHQFNATSVAPLKYTPFSNLHPIQLSFPTLASIGFEASSIAVRNYSLQQLNGYAESRDIPAIDSTSYLSPHLRFGTVSIRQVIAQLQPHHEVFLSELVWREFFQQILVHFPRVVFENFKPQYNGVQWRNNKEEFQRWCEGTTGYPMVDAGMRQLNVTGYMHNRVRMIAAGFLCKHLLIDWRWGEAYFAQKLLDYELASNNGNWQWSAGTGCDAAPYFRIFNPTTQLKKFDPDFTYIKQWITEFGTDAYPTPMVDHKVARERALVTYKAGMGT